MAKAGFTVIELLVVIAVIALLAAIALTTVSSVTRQQQRSEAGTTLKVIDSAIGSYHKIYGRWPVDSALSPPAQTETAINSFTTALNKNILKNLKKDWSKGNFNAFPPAAIRIDSGIDLNDGLEFFADPWGRPYRFKVRVGMHAGKPRLEAIYVYSAGDDGLDDFADLAAWLTAGHGFPVGDDYPIHLAQTQPTHCNLDNVYPPAE